LRLRSGPIRPVVQQRYASGQLNARIKWGIK
jgi:hypothetical protein